MQLSREEVLSRANAVCENTLMETLNIEIIDFGDDFVLGKMPVTARVHQPDGVLHGGATVALAETLGSFAAEILMDLDEVFVRGIEISANHLKSVRDGFVYASFGGLLGKIPLNLFASPMNNNEISINYCIESSLV